MERSTEKEQTVLEQLNLLSLPEGEFMIMGSGILAALGIREARDADMVVSDKLYAQLRDCGWKERTFRSGDIVQTGLEDGPFQVFRDWTDDDGRRKSLGDLLEDADVIDGIAYNSLDKLYAYKLRRRLDKDLKDLELINKFRSGD